MHSVKISIHLLFVIFFYNFLQAQFDPSIMASLSKLPEEERDRLIQQYGSGKAQSKSSELNLNQNPKINEVDETSEPSEHNQKHENTSENLREMEEQISEDIVRLEISLATEISEIEKSATQDALKKSKMLLAKIKELQRLEIQNYTQKLESISSSSNLLPFGYDIFSSPATNAIASFILER